MTTFWSFKKYAGLALAIGIFSFLLIWNIVGQTFPATSGEVELLFPRRSETLTLLQKEKLLFEDVYTDIIMLKTGGRLSDVFILDDLEEDLLTIPGIVSVVIPQSFDGPDIFGLISKDKKYLRVIVKINSILSKEVRAAITSRIDLVLEDYSRFSPMRAGTFVTAEQVSAEVSEETARVIPWIVLLLIIGLSLLLQSIILALMIVGTSGLAIGITILSYSALGFPLGPVSQLVPPFLLAISSSFSVHLASRLLNTPQDLRSNLIPELYLGIIMAAGTTSFSLVTLTFLDVTDVSRFALLAGAGTIIAAVFSLGIILPIFKNQRQTKNFSVITSESLYNLSKKQIVPISVLLFTIFGVGISRLQIHTDPLRFLPPHSKTLQEIRTINKIFPGNHFLSILLSFEKSESTPYELDVLDNLKQRLEKLHSVERVISPSDFSKVWDTSRAADFFSDFSITGARVPVEFLTEDRNHMRILLETEVEGRELLELKERVYQILEEGTAELPYDEFGITSLELIMAEQTGHIVRGLLQSLATTVSIVFVLLLLIFKDLKIAVIGLVPNVLPLLTVFGILGFVLEELDFGSCLVATSALGIAVDNTFHFLLCHREQKRKCANSELAIKETIVQTAGSFSITSIALIGAFSVMIIAQSQPVVHFGVLLAVTLLVGLLADLILLPHLLSKVRTR